MKEEDKPETPADTPTDTPEDDYKDPLKLATKRVCCSAEFFIIVFSISRLARI